MDSHHATSVDPPALPRLFAHGARPDRQLHPDYLTLRDSPLYAPARDVLGDIERALGQPGADFVEQFQTTGFDACLFELFLTAMLDAAGHQVGVGDSRPHLVVSKSQRRAVVDAVTASDPPDSPLLRKLAQRAWANPQFAGLPYVIAVQDPRAHTAPSPTLSRVVSGNASDWYVDLAGRLVEAPADLDKDRDPHGSPPGFFEQPGAENVAAILLCGDSGTISKFNRVGQEGGHHCDAVRMLRYGTGRHCQSGQATHETFAYEVGARPSDPETWSEGTVLIHNPCARQPLPRGWLGAAAEMESARGGMVCTVGDDFHALASVTEVLPGTTPEWWIEERAHLLAKDLARGHH